MDRTPTPGWVPTERTSPAYQAAADEVGSLLARCNDLLAANASGFDRRQLRMPDGYWVELNATLAKFARIARENGEHPEHALIRLKSIADARAHALERDSKVRAAIVRLFIKTYFEH